MSAKSAYNTSKAASGELVESLLRGSALNYVGYRACVRWASARGRKEWKHVEMAEMDRRKDLGCGQNRNPLHKETRNGEWISDIPHHLNDTNLSREGFQNIIFHRYRMMPQDIFATCDGCGKRFLIKQILACPNCGLFLARYNDDAK